MQTRLSPDTIQEVYTNPVEYYRDSGLTVGQLVFIIRRDLEFAMPPKGLTEQRTNMQGSRWKRTTWRCPEEGCWYVCTPSSEENLLSIQKSHKGYGDNPCPSSPRREMLPSGLSEIEKLWREIDDVIDALATPEQTYRGMSAPEVRAYAQGLAFVVVMKEGTQLFADGRAVAKEAMERLRIRQGKLAYRPTRSRFHSASNWIPGGGWVQETENTEPAKPPQKRGVKSVAAAIDPTKLAAIRAAIASGMFSDTDLATMYSLNATVIAELRAKS